jgi:hypothetical protein
MDDSRSASFVMIAGAAGLAYWWFHLTRGELSSTVTAGGPAAGNSGLPEKKVALPPLAELEDFARQYGLKITSEMGGHHNPGSLHYQGRAIDVSSRGFTQDMVDKLKALAASWGITLRDERARSAGQAVWGGGHIHLEVPR